MTNRTFSSATLFAAAALSLAIAAPPAVLAQGTPSDAVSTSAPSEQNAQRAADLLTEAFTVAGRTVGPEGDKARVTLARNAGALLPLLPAAERDALTQRWVSTVQKPAVSRPLRIAAYSSFFDVASRLSPDFALQTAVRLPDAAGRTGAFIDLSEATERTSWTEARKYAGMAQQAARREDNLVIRARALTFVAYRMATLDPAARDAAVTEASSLVRQIQDSRVRDNLLTEVVGAASRFDLGLARRIAQDIGDSRLKSLAVARTNISEISQTTLTTTTQDRISALAQAAARYDVRAIPVLLSLPPQPEVLKSLSDALPAIYPSARPAIDASLLERIWTYTQGVEPSVQRDELQSRVARLMVLHDPWLGRSWGKQLTWKGGRIQVGAFLKDVLNNRRSRLKAGALQELAQKDLDRAIGASAAMPPAARVEALVLIAGQLLG